MSLRAGFDAPPFFFHHSQSAEGASLVATVYVLVTSVNPLTAFLHETSVAMTHLDRRGRVTQVRHTCPQSPVGLSPPPLPASPRFCTQLSDFLRRQLGHVQSHQALGQVRVVIGHVLQAAVSSNEKQGARSR